MKKPVYVITDECMDGSEPSIKGSIVDNELVEGDK